MISLIPLIIDFFEITLQDIIFTINLLFIISLIIYISFIIGRFGMDSFIYLSKKIKLINHNLSLDKRFFNKQRNKIKSLEEEINSLKKELSSKDTLIQLLKET